MLGMQYYILYLLIVIIILSLVSCFSFVQCIPLKPSNNDDEKGRQSGTILVSIVKDGTLNTSDEDLLLYE